MTICDKCKKEVETTWRVTGMCRECASEIRGCTLDELDFKPIEENEINKNPLKFVEMFDRPPSVRRWWFDDLIRHNTVGSTLILLHGREKTGKSWICYHMAIMTALGMNFMGHQASPNIKKTLILSPEGGSEMIRERLWGLIEPLELSEEQIITLNNNIKVVDLDTRILDLTKKEDFTDLQHAINNQQSDVVILDPMIEFTDPKVDENNNKAIAEFMSRLRLLSNKNLIIVLSHHNQKNGSEARGASSILGKYDWRMGLERIDNNNENLEMKINFGSRNSKIPPIKTCIIETRPADGWKNYDTVLMAFSDYVKTSTDHEEEIIEYLSDNISSNATTLKKILTIDSGEKTKFIQKMVDDGKIVLTVDGKYKTYSIPQ